jgi:serine/threonine protein kinase
MLFNNNRRQSGKQIGAYRIIRRIGEGRYGVCFLAESSGRKVILKKLKPGFFKQNPTINPYEAEILAQLHHDGIPGFLGMVNEKGFFGLALEHKNGETIEDLLFREKRSFAMSEIVIIGSRLLAIIGYLHDRGIIHRDVRTPNVLIDGDRVSLVDFGLARREDYPRYTREMDYSYLGDLLLHLLYSSYVKPRGKGRSWYEELALTDSQRVFLKRLLRLEKPFQSVPEITRAFKMAFAGD